MILISDADARRLLSLHARGDSPIRFSADLGRTTSEWVHCPDGWQHGETLLTLHNLQQAADSNERIFGTIGGGFQALELRHPGYIKLSPTAAGIPTIMRDGIQMHRTVNIDPGEDTRRKTKGVVKPGMRVFDTCTGLGYTAIEAARIGARFVLSVERDYRSHQLMRWNPWSADFFSNPRIHPITGDSSEIAACLPDGCFDAIVHDPPRFALAGELYSGVFYRDLYRLLRRNGQLFHYVGKPDSASGKRVTDGVLRRLRDAGFQVKTAEERFGVLAKKG